MQLLKGSITAVLPDLEKALDARVHTALARWLPLLDEAGKTGLVHIYCTDEQARTPILDANRNAKDKVRVLSVISQKPIPLGNILDEISGNHALHPDQTRILIPNPYRSPSVFRAFLCSDCGELGDLLSDINWVKNTTASTETDHRFAILDRDLFALWRAVFEALGAPTNRPRLPFVKFHAMDSQMWIVIADAHVFVKPMTFSCATDGGEQDQSFASAPPILHYNAEISDAVAHAYERHVDVLWKASTDDWKWMVARTKQERSLLRKVFRERGDWLECVFLRPSANRKLRKQYRHVYPNDECPFVDLEMPQAGGQSNAQPQAESLIVSCRILDAAPNGFGVEVESLPQGWKEGTVLEIKKFHAKQNKARGKQGPSDQNVVHLTATAEALNIRRFTITGIEQLGGGASRVHLATTWREA